MNSPSSNDVVRIGVRGNLQSKAFELFNTQVRYVHGGFADDDEVSHDGVHGLTVSGERIEGHPLRVVLHGRNSIQDILYAEIPVPRLHERLPPERDP